MTNNRSNTLSYVLASAVVWPAICSPALAEAPIIVTAAGISQPRDTSGQAIAQIDAATIDRLQSVTIADLLLLTPSIRVNSTGGTGAVTGVSLRGAEIGQTVVLIDGVRVNDPSSPSDATDFGNLLTGNIRSIEVMRGANAVPYGSEAIGGVIALSTIDPTAKDGLSAQAMADGGSFGTVRSRAGLAWHSGGIRAGAGVSYLHTDGISSAAPRFGAKEADGVDNLTFNGRFDIDLGASAGLELRASHIDAQLAYDSFFGAPADSTDESDFRQTGLHGAIRFLAIDDRLASRVSLSLLSNARDYRFTPGTPVDFGYRGETWRAEYQGVLEAATGVKLIGGYIHVEPQYRFFGFGSDETHDARTDGVHGLLLFSPSSNISFSAGARHDRHSAFGGVTTFGANANIGLGDGSTRLRAAFGQGFRAPSLYQLYDSFSGNRALLPERSDSFDIGLDHDLAGVGRLSVTLFQRTTRNQIDYSLATFTYGNLARSRARGVELEGRAKLARGWEMLASYSYVDARNRSAGSPRFNQRLARRALHGATLAIDRSWDNGVAVGLTARASSGATDPLSPTGLIGGYALVDMRASVPVSRLITLQARIENITDALSETAYGYGTPGRAAYVGVRLTL